MDAGLSLRLLPDSACQGVVRVKVPGTGVMMFLCLACPGVVFDPLLTSKELPGFARSFAVAGFVFSLGRKRSLEIRA